MEMDCVSAIRRLEGTGVFDVIYIDAPYGQGLEEPVLRALSESDIADEDTIVVVEEDLDENLDFAENCGFSVTRFKKYKTNQHIFLKKKGI